MTARISVMVLRIAALAALILGILFWTGTSNSTGPIGMVHMTLGIIVALCLLILGILIATSKRGSVVLGAVAIILALVMVGFGASQRQILIQPSVHWIIQVIHLLFGLLAIGLGEMIAGRYRRLGKVA